MRYMEDQKMTDNIDFKNDLIGKMKSLKQQIDVIWGNFIISEIPDGMRLISGMFEDLDKIVTEMNSIKDIDISEFLRCMEKLESAMKVSDYMLISDLVKYEIEPIINTWENELSSKN